jgi:hypothetical protein
VPLLMFPQLSTESADGTRSVPATFRAVNGYPEREFSTVVILQRGGWTFNVRICATRRFFWPATRGHIIETAF